jgi:hypothetical protein
MVFPDTGTHKITIGWREWVSLPGLDIPAIKAKIDTGARTSTLHAFDIKAYEGEACKLITFSIRPLQRRKKLILRCQAALLERRMVSDSGGHRELRYVIQTPVTLGGRIWPIEITLTDRGSLRFRMLLGRTAIRGRYLVDPEKSYLTGRSLAGIYGSKGQKEVP